MSRRPLVLITYPADPDLEIFTPEQRDLCERLLADRARIEFYHELDRDERLDRVAEARCLFSRHVVNELGSEGVRRLHADQMIQTLAAGVDYLPLHRLPGGLVVASNAGAYAEPMAEHVLAMVLALAKRLRPEHENMRQGEFNQFVPNRSVRGMDWGILGYGGVGQAVARLVAPLAGSVRAINRHPKDLEAVDFLATLDELDYVLSRSDVVVVALPLTDVTRGLIGEEELGTMRPEAILVNVARGEIIDQRALYEHLEEHSEFLAGIESWWVEPLRHGTFRVDHPFLELPNVLGSPHNSAQVPGFLREGVRNGLENIRRFLGGDPIRGRVDRSEYSPPPP